MELISRVLPTLLLLALTTALEFWIPLREQSRSANQRLTTNLSLVALNIALSLVLNVGLISVSIYLLSQGFGLFPLAGISGVPRFVLSIVLLDLASYAVHVFMHKHAWAWRFHLVHHIDVAVDATTALRQHPFEGVLRFSATAAMAWSLGVSPETIAIYRLMSATNAIFEHANIKLPPWLDRALVWFWVTPDMHKVHHSRQQGETDTNYANLFSFHDRVFRTLTRSERGRRITYGIEGYGAEQTLLKCLLMPLSKARRLS